MEVNNSSSCCTPGASTKRYSAHLPFWDVFLLPQLFARARLFHKVKIASTLLDYALRLELWQTLEIKLDRSRNPSTW